MMAAERGAARNTLAAYRRDLEQASRFAKGRLAEADAAMLRKIMADYRSLAASRAARKLSALRQFFAFLAEDRKNVVWGRCGSVRVELGGRTILYTKKHQTQH